MPAPHAAPDQPTNHAYPRTLLAAFAPGPVLPTTGRLSALIDVGGLGHWGGREHLG